MSYLDINDPRLVTPAGNPDAPLPKGEPIAKAPQVDVTVCDPRTLLDTEPCGGRHKVEAGDFIRAGSWTKPRRVEHVDTQSDGPVLLLAEHDTSRTNTHGIRRVDKNEWERRSGWVRYPHLRRLWDAAHGDS